MAPDAMGQDLHDLGEALISTAARVDPLGATTDG